MIPATWEEQTKFTKRPGRYWRLSTLIWWKWSGAELLACAAVPAGPKCLKNPKKDQDINVERTEEALLTGATTIAVACPFCMTMMSDGVKNKDRETDVQVKDLAELIAEALG